MKRHSSRLVHEVGTAVVHLGRHRHGVARLTAGERVNLVLWARSSAFRAAAAHTTAWNVDEASSTGVEGQPDSSHKRAGTAACRRTATPPRPRALSTWSASPRPTTATTRSSTPD